MSVPVFLVVLILFLVDLLLKQTAEIKYRNIRTQIHDALCIVEDSLFSFRLRFVSAGAAVCFCKRFGMFGLCVSVSVSVVSVPHTQTRQTINSETAVRRTMYVFGCVRVRFRKPTHQRNTNNQQQFQLTLTKFAFYSNSIHHRHRLAML